MERLAILFILLPFILGFSSGQDDRVRRVTTDRGEYKVCINPDCSMTIEGPDLQLSYKMNDRKWMTDYATEVYIDTMLTMVDGRPEMKIDTTYSGRMDTRFIVRMYPVQNYYELAGFARNMFSSDELSLLSKSNVSVTVRPVIDSVGRVAALKQFYVKGHEFDMFDVSLSSYVRFYESIVSSVLYEDGGLMHKYGANYYSPVYDLLQFQFSPSGIRIVSFPNDPLNLETIKELEKEGLTVRYKSLFTDQ